MRLVTIISIIILFIYSTFISYNYYYYDQMAYALEPLGDVPSIKKLFGTHDNISSSMSSSSSSSPDQILDNNPDFLTYESPKLGTKTQYPSDWHKTEVCCKGNYGHVSFIFISKGNHVKLQYTTPTSYVKNPTLGSRDIASILEKFKEKSTDFYLIKSYPLNNIKGNLAAWQLIYTYNPLEVSNNSPNPANATAEYFQYYQQPGSPIIYVMEKQKAK